MNLRLVAITISSDILNNWTTNVRPNRRFRNVNKNERAIRNDVRAHDIANFLNQPMLGLWWRSWQMVKSVVFNFYKWAYGDNSNNWWGWGGNSNGSGAATGAGKSPWRGGSKEWYPFLETAPIPWWLSLFSTLVLSSLFKLSNNFRRFSIESHLKI